MSSRVHFYAQNLTATVANVYTNQITSTAIFNPGESYFVIVVGTVNIASITDFYQVIFTAYDDASGGNNFYDSEFVGWSTVRNTGEYHPIMLINQLTSDPNLVGGSPFLVDLFLDFESRNN